MPYTQLVLETLRSSAGYPFGNHRAALGSPLRTYARTPDRSFRAHTNPWEVSNVSCPP